METLEKDEKNLETKVMFDLENIETLCQCVICMEEFDNVKRKPMTGSCECKNMICQYCYTTVLKSDNVLKSKTLKSYSGYEDVYNPNIITLEQEPKYMTKYIEKLENNVQKQCPTCRKSTKYLQLDNKIFIIMQEFLNIKDNIQEYIKLHSDCETSQKLIKSLIKCNDVKDDMGIMTLNSITQLMLDLVDRSSAIERETKKNNYSKIKKISQKEQTLTIYEQMLTERDVRNKEWENRLNMRETKVLKIEEERKKVNEAQQVLDNSISQYESLSNELNERSDIQAQNEQLFTAREADLSKSEHIFAEKNKSYNDMMQILDMEMKQLCIDKEKLETEKALFDIHKFSESDNLSNHENILLEYKTIVSKCVNKYSNIQQRLQDLESIDTSSVDMLLNTKCKKLMNKTVSYLKKYEDNITKLKTQQDDNIIKPTSHSIYPPPKFSMLTFGTTV